MNGLKLWCLQSSLEFLVREEGPTATKEMITEYADHFFEYLNDAEQSNATVIPFKPQGVN